MRADQIAYEVFGDISYAQEIIRINRLGNTPIIKAGTVIKIPDKKTDAKKDVGVHLW